jgi:hypothetical protein
MLLTKETNERICHRIPHGLNAFLKPPEFLLNMRQFFAYIGKISRCPSHGFILAE